ncbi:MAG: TIGR03619 family F420-dependent LLM class oxidoreductase [Actinobacteria bacterium]|nr:TIGR03619 family F420-dependent LLM class oxidoreductase [Actinomycetota bacterium]
MRFSYGFPLQQHPNPPALMTATSLSQLSTHAADAGCSAVFLTEHPAPTQRFLSSGGHSAIDPFVGLAACAGAAPDLRLMTHVSVLSYRNPFLLAKSAATLDRISEGRLILGVGAGYLSGEFAALGVDVERRNDDVDASLPLLRQIWTGQPVTAKNHRVNARDIVADPTPVQDPLPLWIGGNAKVTMGRVADFGQGWMALPNPAAYGSALRSAHLDSIDQFAHKAAYLQNRWQANGREGRPEIMYVVTEAGEPSTEDFDPVKYRDMVARYGELGVTWLAVNGAGTTVDGARRWIDRFHDEVLSYVGGDAA